MPITTHGTTARLARFGESVFTRISRLATEHQAVNLGQGFPNFDGPAFVKDAGKAAIDAGFGQYARMYGMPDVNAAIARRVKLDQSIDVDPEREITITSGCTEAIAATMLGLVEPGDEVVLEIEAVGTAATQMLEQVTAQAATVQALCARVEEQATLLRAWNAMIASGGDLAEQDEDN
jgi:DNA-binding transcriptional MocR family regulator